MDLINNQIEIIEIISDDFELRVTILVYEKKDCSVFARGCFEIKDFEF